jgi:hypothetical protein
MPPLVQFLVNMADEPKKVGGIPKVWWYVIGAAGGIGIYFLYKWYENKSAADNAATTLAEEPSGAESNTTSEAPAGTATPLSTYQDWEATVQAWADSLGMDPATVSNALTAYGNNVCLPSNEYTIIDQALGEFGLPPDAPYSGVVQCPQTTPAATTPKTSTPAPVAPAKSVLTKPPANLATTLQSRLAALVGQLSNLTGKSSSPTQVAALKASPVPSWLAPFGNIGAQFYEETINVGNISAQLPGGGGVTAPQADSLAKSLAAEDGYNWTSLNALEQNQYAELANTQLLINANAKPAVTR